MMQQHWQTMKAKFTLLSMRERSLLVGSLLIAIVYLVYSLWLEPVYLQNQKSQSKLTSLQQQQQQYEFDKAELLQALASDPNKIVQLRIARAESEFNKANGKLTDLTADLINSNQMALVLGDVLSRAKNVKLISIESLPVTTLTGNNNALDKVEEKAKPKFSNASGQDLNADKIIKSDDISKNIDAALANSETPITVTDDSEVLLYRHGLRITMTGSFFNIQAYLTQIEQLPKKFYWEVFDYQIQDYPTAQVVMEIYTLSINKEFIRG
ncbi:type II secretion system protein M [Moritella viscosa]|uniref:Glucose-6-phosphate isomerase n=1 Tax=Moritella viscosa TaxID=80854 RepID=A0A1K9ZZ86_9GAMM|nr:type II secretion system protein M [Moritella viscosa]SGZ02649.1 Glucose-6-phosphate isomerase [Moritella viscosa]SHO07324.1 Glucose-6-phosphate isomerase [Moritella viscosa]SHO07417.1 Glucose-6-phosphate isomerase [Moritella viscosa]SHO11306.1 Glucose-6-phosphate isomerase [Moritella viscosa]SHO15606.1 Glucose-6-phosphate isomerase [Moritella viscosa]